MRTRTWVIFITVNITKPDLAVSTGDIKGLDDTDELMERVDSRVTIKAEIHNEGNAEANSIQVKLYVDEVLKGTKSISSIEPERSKEVSFSWTVEAIETLTHQNLDVLVFQPPYSRS